jgi:hypothetical protein
VCVCVCVCEREERMRRINKKHDKLLKSFPHSFIHSLIPFAFVFTLKAFKSPSSFAGAASSRVHEKFLI